MSLTHILLTSSLPGAVLAATQHPFLLSAGNGSLPSEVLCRWLQQDIHYTRAYIRFLGGLLSKLHLPATLAVEKAHSLAAEERRLLQRVFDLVVFALNNIQRETGFFEDVIREHGLQLPSDDRAEPVTRAYQDFFVSVGAPHASLVEGLVALWGTEWCYLNAWRYASQNIPKEEPVGPSNVALRTKFIPNWASREFECFVDDCASVADMLYKHEVLNDSRMQGDRADVITKKCKEVFAQVLWLEAGFWPEVPDHVE